MHIFFFTHIHHTRPDIFFTTSQRCPINDGKPRGWRGNCSILCSSFSAWWIIVLYSYITYIIYTVCSIYILYVVYIYIYNNIIYSDIVYLCIYSVWIYIYIYYIVFFTHFTTLPYICKDPIPVLRHIWPCGAYRTYRACCRHKSMEWLQCPGRRYFSASMCVWHLAPWNSGFFPVEHEDFMGIEWYNIYIIHYIYIYTHMYVGRYVGRVGR